VVPVMRLTACESNIICVTFGIKLQLHSVRDRLINCMGESSITNADSESVTRRILEEVWSPGTKPR